MWTVAPPGSSVHGILQARMLERVAMPSSRGSSPPRDQTQVSYTGRGILHCWAAREAPYYCYSLLIPPIAIEVSWEQELSLLGLCLHLPGPACQMSSLLDRWGGGGDWSHLPPASTKQNLAVPHPHQDVFLLLLSLSNSPSPKADFIEHILIKTATPSFTFNLQLKSLIKVSKREKSMSSMP